MISGFHRAGALVFGGGRAVLPLLQEAYLGATAPGAHAALTTTEATLAIFLPGLRRLRADPRVR